MRVDHRGTHITMSKELLHPADILARLQHMRGERVAQRVGRNALRNAGAPGSAGNATTDRADKDVMAACLACTGIGRELLGREGVLPDPLLRCRFQFSVQSFWDVGIALSFTQVLFKQRSYSCQVLLE